MDSGAGKIWVNNVVKYFEFIKLKQHTWIRWQPFSNPYEKLNLNVSRNYDP